MMRRVRLSRRTARRIARRGYKIKRLNRRVRGGIRL